MLILSSLVMWELVRKYFDNNEVENVTNFVEVRLFKVFLKLPGYKLCIWKKMYNCDNGIKSRSVPFYFGWCIHPCCSWGEEVPWLCVGEAAAYGAKRSHAREVLFDMLSLLPMGERKTFRVWVRLLSMGPKVCILERTISC